MASTVPTLADGRINKAEKMADIHGDQLFHKNIGVRCIFVLCYVLTVS